MENITKTYYTIGEVAEMINESPSLIRFWEKKFKALKPEKTEKGTRKFNQQDIELIRLIHYLVKVKGYTLAGAADYIKQQKEVADTAAIVDKLQRIKSFLTLLKKKLDS